MPSDRIKVLLIEDEASYARLVHDRLSEETAYSFEVESASTLQEGLARLAKTGADVILADLFLPDSRGLETFLKLHTQVPELPIVVLTVHDDDTVALEAVRAGAQDFLVKGYITDTRMLGRVIQYAIERQRMQSTLQSLALIDELTGVYNRRGFLSLAGQHLKLAQRTQRGSLLIFVDVDGLKQINDQFGHAEGDAALVAATEILKRSLRTSDVIARIGGDEFAVIAIEAHEDSGQILAGRIRQQTEERHAQGAQKARLALSVGWAYLDPQHPFSLEELMRRADEALYDAKRHRAER